MAKCGPKNVPDALNVLYAYKHQARERGQVVLRDIVVLKAAKCSVQNNFARLCFCTGRNHTHQWVVCRKDSLYPQ